MDNERSDQHALPRSLTRTFTGLLAKILDILTNNNYGSNAREAHVCLHVT